MPFIDKPYFLHRLAEASSSPHSSKDLPGGSLESLAWIMCALACRVKLVAQLDAVKAENAENIASNEAQFDWSSLARRYWKRARRAIDLEPRPGVMTGRLFLFLVLCFGLTTSQSISANEDLGSEILGRS
jgi:hypothetical protein